MAYQSEISKVLEIPTNFYIGHLIGGKGETIRDIQELTGAEIIIDKDSILIHIVKPRTLASCIVAGMQLNENPSKTLEIRGSPNAVKFAEEFVLAFFKHPDPSQGSDGLNNSFLFGIVLNLRIDSVLREKILKSEFYLRF